MGRNNGSARMMLDLFFHASLPIKLVLVVLAGFSVFSWGVILYKARQFSRASRQTGESRGRSRSLPAQEREELESYLIVLATTGSTAPFIGLLGTVWGIMDAFRGIGAAGSASLAVVAPAIAEALVTTAAGLAAAIPAVIAYNVFVNRLGKLSGAKAEA